MRFYEVIQLKWLLKAGAPVHRWQRQHGMRRALPESLRHVPHLFHALPHSFTDASR